MRIKKTVKAYDDITSDASVKKDEAVCYIKNAMEALALSDDECCKESIANLSVVLVDLQDSCCQGESYCPDDSVEVFDSEDSNPATEIPMV